MKKLNKNRKGFTLIELIVVIAILAILTVLAVMNISNLTQQAREAAINSDATTVASALNLYNSIATTPIEDKGGGANNLKSDAGGSPPIGSYSTSTGKVNLNIPTGAGAIVMDLSVFVDSGRIVQVISWVEWDATNGIWKSAKP